MRKTHRTLAISLLATAVTVCAGAAGPVFAQTSATVRQVPKFRADGSWAKLPSQWVMSLVASTSVDARDHVWVLQRPRSLSEEESLRAAPPVLEFDAEGNFVQGWGGPSEGYDWPQNEHGIHVDPDGYVWVGGNGEEDQILKFTRDGEFVLQIGEPGHPKTNADTENLYRPADMMVYAPTNELFVADGYGNKRVIVFDAETGAFKRMWGAFGNVPSDDPPSPGEPMGPDGAAQFRPPVHAIKVSDDGLVYVADRAGRRVQVFTTDGVYVDQVFIGRECQLPDCGNGSTAAGLAFSPDADQRYLYVANRSQAKLMVLDRVTLEYLDAFGSWGSEAGQFGTLHHLSADSRGNLYTAEVTPLTPVNRRVQRFTFTGFVPLPAVR